MPTITGTDANETLEGGVDNDTINGLAGDDSLVGNDGDDRLTGDVGADTLRAGAGNDYLRGDAGNDILDGGSGRDEVSYSNENGAFDIDLAAGTAVNRNNSDTDTLISIEWVYGSQFGDDSITGSDDNNHLFGNVGMDTLRGGAGDDSLEGYHGNDTLDGGEGSDVAFYRYDDAGVTVDLGAGTATDGNGDSDTLIAIENIDGSAFADNLAGSNSSNLIVGNGGNDSVEGNDGNDTILGGDGNDELHGTAGDDSIEGGAGDDSLNGNADNDTLRGGEGNDSLVGQAGDDELHGDDGNDILRGEDGNDNLFGGGGNDHMEGGEGNDHLNGQGGDDTLIGGGGNDSFFIDVNQVGNRVITDFDPASDTLDLYGFTNDTDAQGILATAVQDGSNTVFNLGSDSVTLLNVNKDDLSTSNFSGIAVHNGTDGDDTLTAAGTRADMTGGGGADRFVIQDLQSHINIDDFVPGTDVIDLSGTALGLVDFSAVQAVATEVNGNVDIRVGNGTLSIRGRTLAELSSSDFIYGGVAVGQNIVGSENAESLSGGAANDTIEGNGGDDTIHGNEGDDELHGTGGNDYVDGGPGDDNLNGNEGDDTVFGQDGADSISGQAGNDQLHGSAGNDTVRGGDGDDYVGGNEGDDSLFGDAGDDYLQGHGGNDTIDGGAETNGNWVLYNDQPSSVSVDLAAGTADDGEGGTDTLFNIRNAQGSITGNDTIQGDANNNTLRGWGGNDTLVGRDGDDALLGDDGDDSLVAGAGDDYVRGGAGTDTLDGGTGTDRVSFWIETGDITVDLEAGTASGSSTGNDTLISVESATGSNTGNDTLSGSTVANLLDGAGGDDSLKGGGGDDTLTGQEGNDTLIGDAGNDRFVIDGNSSDIIRDFTSGDILEVSATIFADFAAFSAAATQNGSDLTIDLGNSNTLTLEGVTLAGLSAGDFDFIAATNQTINGTAANDTLVGGSANDTLFGDAGNDNLTGGSGDDSLNGGDGTDVANYYSESAGVTVDLVAGTATGTSAGNDTLINIEDVNGSNTGNDHIIGDGVDNLLSGGGGDDTIDGGDNGDALYGNAGNDVLLGKEGIEDTLDGGAGDDTLDGGNGFDRVQYYYSSAGANVNLQTGTASDGEGGTDTILNVANVTGSNAGNDTILGTSSTNIIDGYGGDDSINGGDGDDTVSGGEGADRFVVSGTSSDHITDFNASQGDIIEIPASVFADFAALDTAATENAGTLEINMGSGNTLYLSGVTKASLNAANFEFIAAAVGQNVNGTSGNDTLNGGDGPDTISGGDGGDKLHGGAGNDSISGGEGQDHLYGNAGDDTLDGGDHLHLYDIANYFNDPSGANVDLSTGTAVDGHGGNDTLLNIEAVSGSDTGNDTIQGDGNANHIWGEGGDDSISAGDGDDYLVGQRGNDTLDGGAGIDSVTFLGEVGSGVSVNLETGQAVDAYGGQDRLTNIEVVTTTFGNDTIVGAGVDETLTGGEGDDSIFGGAGNDILIANDGNDTLEGGEGDDRLVGWTGVDRFIIDGASSDQINNFTAAEDIIDLSKSGLSLGDFDAISAAATQTSPDTVIDLGGGNTLTIKSVALTSLSASNFIFPEGAKNFTGTEGADSFEGSALDDTAEGNGGNDTLRGHDGNDQLHGTAGDDSIYGGNGNDDVNGNDDNDYVEGGDGDDTVRGQAGNDTLDGGAGSDQIDGGDGNDWAVYVNDPAAVVINLATGTATHASGAVDTLSNIELVAGSNAGADTFIGSSGSDEFWGYGGNDTISGNGGDDFLIGMEGDDSLVGGAGNDYLQAHAGADTLDGGDGVDRASYYFSPSAVHIDLTNGIFKDGFGTDDVLISIENISGSENGDDTLVGDHNDNRFHGYRGADTIDGRDGTDTVDYQHSAQAVNVNLGAGTASGGDAAGDSLSNIEALIGSNHNDTLVGDDGRNTLTGGAGADSLDGGGQHDFVDYGDSDAGVNINLTAGTASGGHAEGDILVNIENIYASSHSDTLTGDAEGNGISGQAGDDTIIGLGGEDWLNGMSGADSLSAGDGNDTMFGGDGNDILDGGAGTDTVTYLGDLSGVVANLQTGTATDGAGDTDTLIDVENLIGSDSNDSLIGSSASNQLDGLGGNDTIEGGDGDDVLNGGVGDDTLRGQAGNDQLNGAEGNDLLEGGDGDDGFRVDEGDDTLTGGGGGDYFSINTNTAGNVVITDFDPNADNLSLQNFSTEAAAANALTAASQNGNDVVFTIGSTTVTVQNTNLSDFRDSNYEAFPLIIGTDGDDTITLSGAQANTDSRAGSDTIVLLDIADSILLHSFDPATDRLDLSATSLGLTDFAAIQAASRDENGNLVIDVQSGFVELAGVAIGDLSASNFVFGGALAGKSINGTAGGDRLNGGLSDDTIEGQQGNDTLYGHDGNDEIHGGLDHDIMFGGEGHDTLVGNEDNDTLFGGAGDDSLIGEDGNDNPQGEAGKDTLTGGNGNDTLQGGDDNDVADGGEGDDIVYGDAGDDSVVGGAGNDVVRGVEGDDTVRGGDGDDYVRGDQGADILDGGAGIDRASYYGSTNAVHVNLETGVAQDGFGTTDTLIDVERVSGSATGDDTLIGDGNDNLFHGYGGADSFDGAGGFDTVDYQHSDAAVNVNLGANTATGGHATGDTLTGIENLIGSIHNDTLTGDANWNWLNGWLGADTLDGGEGIDTADYSQSNEGVQVNLGTNTGVGGHAEGDTFISIENVYGSGFNDTIVGDDGNNMFTGSQGDDSIDGGAGVDTADFGASQESVTVDLSAGTATGAETGTDTLVNIEQVVGSNQADMITGNSQANYIWGSGGNDTILGGDEASTADGVETDHLFGDAGDDSINAGGGDDYLRGGTGNDTLDGGAGNDRASYYNSTTGITVDLGTGQASDGLGGNDTLLNVEDISGSNFGNDSILGDGEDNKLQGYAGADTLDGAGGSDMVDYQHSGEAVHVNLATGAVSGGNAEGDVLSNIENIQGSRYGDTLVGNTDASLLIGREGDDTLSGNDGDDTLTGGEGADTFVVDATSSDAITDFDVSSGDVIDLQQSGLPFFTLQNVTSAATENSGNTVINLGNGETLTLEGVTIASLTTSNFVFADNVAPSGADTTVTTNEDTGYVVQISDFGFNDPNPGSSLAEVRFDNAVPGLELNGAQVAIGQIVAASDIAAGNLIYTPAQDENGDAYTAIEFSVGDGGLFAPTPSTITVNVTAQNDAPTATASTATAVEDTGFVLSAGNFGFADVDALSTFVSVEIVSPITGLTLNNSAVTNNQVISLADISAGNLVYTPPQDVNGQGIAGLTFRVSDGIAQSDAATLTFDVLGVNDTPTATNLPTDVTVIEDTLSNIPFTSLNLADVDAGSANISVFLNANAGSLTATAGGGVTVSGSGGSLTLTGTVSDLNTFLRTDGNVQYTGAENVSGDNKDTIVVTANDGGNTGIGAPATVFLGIVNVDITATNDAPEAVADTFDGSESVKIFVNVLANDIDPDGDALTVSLNTTGTQGVVELLDANSGAVSYDPNGLFDGLFEGQTQTDTFQYTVSDGTESRTETVTINVNGEGTLVATLNTVTENVAGASVGTLSSATGFTPLSAGSGDVFTSSDNRFDISADGTIKLKDGVSLDYEAEASVDFTITRTQTGGDQETLDVTVNVADAPAGSAQDGFIAKALVFIDTNGNGTFDDGTDPWTTTDAGGNFELPQGVNGTLILQGGVNPKTGQQAVDISTGLDFNGTLTAPSGSTVLTPLTTLINTLVQNGDSVSDAESKVSDAFGISASVDLTTFDPINAALTGDAEGSKVFAAGSQVLSTVVLTSAVVEGAGGTGADTAAFDALAAVVSNASGTVDLGDSTTITGVIDGAAASASGSVNTSNLNDAKTAATAIITATNESVETNLAGASDTKTALTSVTQTAIVAQGDAATNLESAVGDNTALTNANSNYTGGNLTTAVSSAVVGTIEPGRIFTGTSAAETLNGAGGDDTLRGLDGNDTLDGKDGTDEYVIDGNSSDTIASFTAGETIDLTATRTYTLDFSGAGSTLAATAKSVQSGSDVVITLGNGETVTVQNTNLADLSASNFNFAVNSAPTAAGSTITINEDTPRAITTTDLGYSDSNGDALSTVRIDSLPNGAAGSLTLNNVAVAQNQEIAVTDIAGGKLVFTPAQHANGNALGAFTFSVSDGTSYSSASASLTFNVTAVNDAPVAGNVDLGATNEDTSVVISTASLIANTTDQENDALSITSLTLQNSSQGTVTDNQNGTYTYTPASQFSGNDVTFNFTVSDGNGGTDTATAVIDVSNVNDAPQGANQTVNATSSILSFTASSFGYSDAENDALSSVVIVTVPSAGSGTLSLDGGTTPLTNGATVTRAQLDAGNLVFVAANGASGDAAASFTFQVNDGTSNSASTNTVTININAAPTGTNGTKTVQSGSSLTLSESDFGFSDANSADTLSAVRIDSATTGLSINGTAVQAGDDISIANIRAGLLRFTPQSGDTNVVINFSVNDGTTYAASPSSLTVTVTSPPNTGNTTTPPSNSGGDNSDSGSSGGSNPDEVGDTLTGGVSSDVIIGGSTDDFIEGGDGGDSLRGGDGDDSIAGGTGNDEVFAGQGDTGDDTIQGNVGDDILGGGAGSDFLVGGDVGANLDPNNLSDAGNDTLFGGDGNDFIVAGAFDTETQTVLNTGFGENLIWAGTGDDTVFGDDQNDILGGGFGSDFINAGDGNDVLYGGKGAASDNHDTLSGGGGGDAVFASLGEDEVTGGSGDDTLFGGGGDDTVDGGADNDQIWGGAGNDALTGGSGNDTFAFVSGFGADVISDFSNSTGNTDVLQLFDIDEAVLQSIISGATFSGGNTLLTVSETDTILLTGIDQNEFLQLVANDQIVIG